MRLRDLFHPKRAKKLRTPWILRLPSVFSINSSLTFIALMVFVVGISALFGVSDPQTLTSKMVYPVYKAWGGGLALTGGALFYAILARDFLLEKFSARIMSMSMLTFAAWIIAANGLSRAIVTASLCAMVVFLLEQRISLLNVMLQGRAIAYDFEDKQRQQNFTDNQLTDSDAQVPEEEDRK